MSPSRMRRARGVKSGDVRGKEGGKEGDPLQIRLMVGRMTERAFLLSADRTYIGKKGYRTWLPACMRWKVYVTRTRLATRKGFSGREGGREG